VWGDYDGGTAEPSDILAHRASRAQDPIGRDFIGNRWGSGAFQRTHLGGHVCRAPIMGGLLLPWGRTNDGDGGPRTIRAGKGGFRAGGARSTGVFRNDGQRVFFTGTRRPGLAAAAAGGLCPGADYDGADGRTFGPLGVRREAGDGGSRRPGLLPKRRRKPSPIAGCHVALCLWPAAGRVGADYGTRRWRFRDPFWGPGFFQAAVGPR